MAAINDVLAGLPRSRWVVGSRAVPVYLACGVIGGVCGLIALVLVTALTGRSLAVSIGVAGVTLAVFAALGVARKRIFGREENVLLREVYTALAAAAGALAVTGNPVLAHLDPMIVGLCAFLAWGRVGCSVTGCCYGVAAQHGILYPPDHRPDAPRVRRLPVQLAEAAVWAVLAIAGAAIAARGQPGHALAAVLIGYGIARIALEAWRDDPRPHWLGYSLSTWLAALGIAGGLALYSDPRAWTRGELVMLALGVALLGAVHAGRRRWLALPDALPAAIVRAADAIGRDLARGVPGPAVVTRAVDGLVVGASRQAFGDAAVVTLSMSRQGPPLDPAEAAFLLDVVACAMGRRSALPPVIGRSGVYVVALAGAMTGVASGEVHTTADIAGEVLASASDASAERLATAEGATAPASPSQPSQPSRPSAPSRPAVSSPGAHAALSTPAGARGYFEPVSAPAGEE